MKKFWTEKEVKLLQRNYPKRGSQIKELLRTKSNAAIKMKASSLGLFCRSTYKNDMPAGYFTLNEAARITNYSRGHLGLLIRLKKIKSKIHKKSPYKNKPNLIAASELKKISRVNKPTKYNNRCEPCTHKNKILCTSCKKWICANDYSVKHDKKNPRLSSKCKNCIKRLKK